MTDPGGDPSCLLCLSRWPLYKWLPCCLKGPTGSTGSSLEVKANSQGSNQKPPAPLLTWWLDLAGRPESTRPSSCTLPGHSPLASARSPQPRLGLSPQLHSRILADRGVLAVTPEALTVLGARAGASCALRCPDSGSAKGPPQHVTAGVLFSPGPTGCTPRFYKGGSQR